MIDDTTQQIDERVQLIVQTDEDRTRLDRFCAAHLTNLSRSYVKTLIKKECVQVNGQIKKANWYFGGNAFSLTFNAGEDALPGLEESDVTSIVNQIQ